MRKYIVLTIVTLLIAFIVFDIKSGKDYISDTFWNVISKQFEKEEAEREQKIANHEIVRGKDTVLIWNNMYEILHFSNDNRLSIHSDKTDNNILHNITMQKKIHDKLFIISDEGYAVINDENICKIFVTVPNDEFVSEYSKDENGNKLYRTRVVSDEHIQYINSYDEFSEEERACFDKLQEKNSK